LAAELRSAHEQAGAHQPAAHQQQEAAHQQQEGE
jgi:hypothetical protein